MSKTWPKIAALVLGSIVAAAPASAQTGGGGEDAVPGSSVPSSDLASDVAGDVAGPPETPAAIEGPWMEGVPAETQQAAREIFLQGNVLIRDTLFAKAAARYREAIALWQHPAFYFNLAIAQLALDQPIEAYHSLEQALRHGEAPLGAHRYRQAGIHLQRLDRELARIEVVCDEPGATVTLDGKLLFEAPGRHEEIVRPGGHQLVVHKIGYLTETRQLVLSPGQRMAVALELTTLEQARESSRRWAAWKPWSVAGAGMVVGMAGAVLDWRARSEYERFDADFAELGCAARDRAPDVMTGCSASEVPLALEDTLARARWQQRAAITLYAAAGATVATGAVLLYFNRPRARTSDVSTISVSGFIAPDSGLVTASVRF